MKKLVLLLLALLPMCSYAQKLEELTKCRTEFNKPYVRARVFNYGVKTIASTIFQFEYIGLDGIAYTQNLIIVKNIYPKCSEYLIIDEKPKDVLRYTGFYIYRVIYNDGTYKTFKSPYKK